MSCLFSVCVVCNFNPFWYIKYIARDINDLNAKLNWPVEKKRFLATNTTRNK